MQKSDLVGVRAGLEGDNNFIFASWLRGLFYGGSHFSMMPKDIFMTNYHKVIEYILKNPKTTIKVACLKDDPEVILGYAILGNNETTLHYVFVKNAWRKIGLAKLLIPDTVKSVSHLTKTGIDMLKKHKEIVYNPFTI